MANLDLRDIIDETRAEAGPLFVKARLEAEAEARELLDSHAGSMTPQLASQLGKILNRHYWGTGIRFNRFLPGFSEPLLAQMVSDIDHFNRGSNDLWRAGEETALETADRILTDKGYLPGAGQSFPTVLLYLRSPDQYFTWFNRVDQGLASVVDYPGRNREDGVDGYHEFCRGVRDLITEYGLEPQEVDAVLSEVARRAVEAEVAVVEEASTSTLTEDAFEFLQQLQQNNTKEWFDANRDRYQTHVRDPLAEVFEAVADRYIRGLDPKLNTEVQRDEVLARIYKYGTGDPYYPITGGPSLVRRSKKTRSSISTCKPTISTTDYISVRRHANTGRGWLSGLTSLEASIWRP